MEPVTVLIVDDDESARVGLGHALRGSGYRLLFADGPRAGLECMAAESVDVVISDHLMPGTTGLEFLSTVRDRYPDAVRIMLTGHADGETAIRAINQGEIYRFLHKPCDRTELRVTLHLACEKLALERENRRLLALIRTSPELQRRLDEETARRTARGHRPE
jgi:DNA-binding NtrC family response regulator